MKKNKTKMIVGGLLIAGIITYVIIRRNKNKEKIKLINDILDAKVTDPNAGSQVIINKSEYDKLPNGEFPLKFGSKSKKVYDVQMALNKKFGVGISVDGKYGDTTFQALCDKVWNSGYLTTKYGDCYRITTSGYVRRSISIQDWNSIK